MDLLSDISILKRIRESSSMLGNPKQTHFLWIYLGASYVPKVDLKTQSKQLSGYCTSPLGCIPDVSQSPSRSHFSGAPRPESRAPRPGRQSSRTLLFSSFRQRPPIAFGCSVVFSPPLSYLRWCSSQPSFPNECRVKQSLFEAVGRSMDPFDFHYNPKRIHGSSATFKVHLYRPIWVYFKAQEDPWIFFIPP